MLNNLILKLIYIYIYICILKIIFFLYIFVLSFANILYTTINFTTKFMSRNNYFITKSFISCNKKYYSYGSLHQCIKCAIEYYSFCLPYPLFARILASLLNMPIMLICFMPFHMLFASLLSIACLLVSCLCLYMYIHGARMLGARAQSPRCRQKEHGWKHVVKPSGSVQQIQELSLSLWLCTLLNPFISPPFLSQMACIRYIMSCTIRPHL